MTKVIDETSEFKKVEAVNKILRKVFGVFAKGDCMRSKGFPLTRIRSLGFIAKGISLPFFYMVVGEFTKEDGSELRILPKYEKKGKEYGKLYKRKFGKDVILTLDPYVKGDSLH